MTPRPFLGMVHPWDLVPCMWHVIRRDGIPQRLHCPKKKSVLFYHFFPLTPLKPTALNFLETHVLDSNSMYSFLSGTLNLVGCISDCSDFSRLGSLLLWIPKKKKESLWIFLQFMQLLFGESLGCFKFGWWWTKLMQGFYDVDFLCRHRFFTSVWISRSLMAVSHD